jgi:hypothetical protein
MMSDEITLEEMVTAGFPKDAWPEDLPMPGPSNLRGKDLEEKKEVYRYQTEEDGHAFAMEVVLDRDTIPDPAEGVTFMLNQFAYLWRTDKSQIQCAADGACRRINF